MLAQSGNFCSICGEPKAAGHHPLPDDIAKRSPKGKCEKCNTESPPKCMMGIGTFYYVCKCGYRWWSA